MDLAELRGVGQDDILRPLGQHRIDHLGPHHVAPGKTGIGMETVDADKGLTEMDLLDTLTCQRADHRLATLLVHPPHQDDIAVGLLEEVGDIGADGDQGDVLALGQVARQQGISTAAFDENGLPILNQRGGIGGQLLLQGEVNPHTRIDLFALFAFQGGGETVYPLEVVAFL